MIGTHKEEIAQLTVEGWMKPKCTILSKPDRRSRGSYSRPVVRE